MEDAWLRTRLRIAYTHANTRWGQGNRLKAGGNRPRPITLATTALAATGEGPMSRGIKDSATLTKLDQQAANTGDAFPAFLKKKIAGKKGARAGGGGKKRGLPPAFLAQQGKK